MSYTVGKLYISVLACWMKKREIPHAKCNRRKSIGYCPHLWKSPLQPFQPAQQSH